VLVDIKVISKRSVKVMTEHDKQKEVKEETDAQNELAQKNKKDDPKSTDKEDVYNHDPKNADYKKAD